MIIDIKQRRKELGLTLEKIGNMVGVSKSTVKKWESGYIQNMRRDKIMLLANALRVSPLDILDSSDTCSEEFCPKTEKALTSEYIDLIKAFFQCDGIDNTIIFHSKKHAVLHKLSAETYQRITELLGNTLD